MSDFDPYAILGITTAATPTMVKSAYRQRVQVAHPDRGGDPDQFMLIVRAFGLLSDPDARRLYDETGCIDEDGARNYRRDVASILVDMFDAAVETAVATGLDLTKLDFVAQMTAAVTTGLGDARVKLARADRQIGEIQSLRARIRRADSGPNLFVERLDAQIAARTEQHATIRRRVAMLETALVELGNYQSETELITALETRL